MPELTVEALRDSAPADFVTTVKEAEDEVIRRAMSGPEREALLDALFGRFPGFFRADKAGDLDARIDVRLTGAADGGSDTYAVVVKDGACTIEKTPSVEPTVSLMTGPVEFLKILTRSGNPVMMAMTGKLKVRGDLALAQRFGDYFDVRRG